MKNTVKTTQIPLKLFKPARLFWILGALTYIGLYITYLPVRWQKYDWLATPAWQNALGQFGITPSLATGYVISMEMASVLASAIMASIMFWRKPNDKIVFLSSFTLVAFGISAGTTALVKHAGINPVWGTLLDAASSLAFSLALLMLLTVPDGRFIPRWTKKLMIVWAVWMLVGLAFPAVSFFMLRGDGATHIPNGFLLFIVTQAIVFGAGVISQIYRYSKVSTPLQQQQTKWIVFSMTLVLIGYVSHEILGRFFPELSEPNVNGMLFLLVGSPLLYNLPRILLPIFIGMAILRYQLFEIDTLINRSLVYGTLTIIVGVIYLGSVSLLQIAFRTTSNQMSDPAIVLSTAFIAIIFQPLRRYLQDKIDQRFYREKINFRQAFQVFTREVRHYIELPELLKIIVQRITGLFHSSYGAIYLFRANNFQLAEAYSLPVTGSEWLPSVAQLDRLKKGEIIAQKDDYYPVVVPLLALWADRRELVGALALGPKRSEMAYGREDISQLNILIDEAGTAISLAQSVIEKQKAEQEREAAKEAVQMMSANHETVLNNIADGVLVLDLKGDFLSANPALLKMIPQDHLQEIITHPLEKTVKWKRKIFSVTAAPVPDVGTVAVFRDETRRNEMERAKDSMIATASHELRTPLTVVMNYLEMLLVLTRNGRINVDSFTEHLNRALENSQRLHRLVLAILDQAQIHAGRMVLKKQRLNLPAVFETTRQLLNDLIVQKNLSYQLTIHEGVPDEIIGDAERLQQVLTNLIGNAVKFTRQGGIQVAVHCQDTGILTVAVADTGPGIPPEQLPDIFEAFRRSSDYAHRENQGAGLGLSTVKELVTLMGGHISVSSEVGAGSVFTITIPITLPHE